MIKRLFSVLSMALLGLSMVVVPAQALPAAPEGCTTSVEWVQQGNSYWYGKGNIQCTTGAYKAKLVCRNQQTGVAYVKYGTTTVSAPATATATCNTGNTAEGVYASEQPPAPQMSSCVSWAEWVHQGSSHFYGRGVAQCDTGTYKVKIVCRNQQTGVGYVRYGTQVVSAPNTTATTCNSGNTAESVHAVQHPPATGMAGCVSWREWVHQGSSHYYGRGIAQCDSGTYQVKITCKNLQTGQVYDVRGQQATAPNTATGYCYSGNQAQSVTAVAI